MTVSDRSKRSAFSAGRYERHSRLAYAAKVHDEQGEQDDQAKGKRARIQSGNGRDHCADPSRNCDRHIQQVVQQQRDACAQPGIHPEIVLGHQVCAPAIRVSGLGLAIGEVQGEQLRHDRERDPREVLEPGDAEQQQHRQRGLRSVSRRRQRVQPQDGYASDDRELFFLGFLGSERAAKNDVAQGHGGRRSIRKIRTPIEPKHAGAKRL